MKFKWNKFILDDESTHPKMEDEYLVFGICPLKGFYSCFRTLSYYKSDSGMGECYFHFKDIIDGIVLYWAEVPDPEDFNSN